MPSRSEQIILAVLARLEAVPSAKVERNTAVPEKIPAGGLIVLRDGDPGEPDTALGGFGGAYYSKARASKEAPHPAVETTRGV